MEKDEIIITTAKEIFLKTWTHDSLERDMKCLLPQIDEAFKALIKTVSEAYPTEP